MLIVKGLKVAIFNGKRCEVEIINDILSFAQEDIKKTRLLYKANLSYNTFSKYMNFLLEKKLLGTKIGNPSGNIYYTTEKGKDLWDSIQDVIHKLK